jgi:N-acyl-D-aspartate/D-glutamate deacylase
VINIHRQAIINEFESGSDAQWENFIKGAGFKNIIVSVSPGHQEYIGKSIAQIAEMEAKTHYRQINI